MFVTFSPAKDLFVSLGNLKVGWIFYVIAERVDCLDITSFLLYEPVISSNLSYDFDLSFLSSLDINSFTYLY